MNRRDFSKVFGVATLAPSALARANETTSDWSLSANVTECCSCEIPCPCNFGRPTKQRCDGNRLIEIYEGNVGDVQLTGVRFLVTFEMGEWTRIYLDDALNDSQTKAFEAVLPLAFGYFHRLALSVERVPMTVARTSDRISFNTPASEVEMKPLVGLDGGLITVNGLPSNVFHDYVQYESVRHIHRGPDRQWSHTGTNGFTSRMLASG